MVKDEIKYDVRYTLSNEGNYKARRILKPSDVGAGPDKGFVAIEFPDRSSSSGYRYQLVSEAWFRATATSEVDTGWFEKFDGDLGLNYEPPGERLNFAVRAIREQPAPAPAPQPAPAVPQDVNPFFAPLRGIRVERVVNVAPIQPVNIEELRADVPVRPAIVPIAIEAGEVAVPAARADHVHFDWNVFNDNYGA